MLSAKDAQSADTKFHLSGKGLVQGHISLFVAQLFYVDASYMDTRSGQALPLQGLTKDSVIVQHAQRQKENVAIYRLPASPLFEGPDVRGLSLPDLYDYAFVISGAQATTAE